MKDQMTKVIKQNQSYFDSWEIKKTKILEELKEVGLETIKQISQNLFNTVEGLNVFVVRGWTPSWNDGEECTHTESVYVGHLINGKYLDYDDYDDLKRFFEPDGEPINEIRFSRVDDHIEQTICEILQFIYGTNYTVIVRKTDEGVEVEYEEYECEY